MEAAVLSKPHYDEKGFDTHVFEEDHRMFGVFDGMGISEGARGASNLAANMFFNRRSDGIGAVGLGGIIDQVSKSIAVHFPDGGTTATVTRIDSAGTLHFAHVGDSRLYIVKDKRVKQVTADEGIGNRLSNYCGPYTHGCVQANEILEDEWDAFMICSDGITGDWPEQRLSDELIEVILNEYSPADACQMLYDRSIKQDDKTVIVVRK